MTDREMLELAAKAAGHTVEAYSKEQGLLIKVRDGVSAWWNPKANDGDAMRLAVKLAQTRPGASFSISISKMHDGRGFSDAGFFSHINPTEQAIDEDIAVATRRAIVRAAAEIGKAMP